MTASTRCEGGVGEQAAGEDAFGDEAEAGARAADIFEADLVADGVADFFCAPRRHGVRPDGRRCDEVRGR